jgi:hypothetical protein
MTYFPLGYGAVPHPRDRRRAWIISIVIAVGLSLLASIFGWHPPDPKSCDPELPQAGFVFTQTATPTTLTLGCPGSGQSSAAR